MFSWLFKPWGTSDNTSADIDIFDDSDSSSVINPASGLPMIGGMGGLDVEGNAFGTDSHDIASNMFEDTCDSIFNDDLGTISSIDDDFGCSSFMDDDF